MGKNLKGKEGGKGICQRKDSLYYARFVDKTGKRHEKYLPKLATGLKNQNTPTRTRMFCSHRYDGGSMV